MKKITLPLVFILSIITIWYFSIQFKSTAEHNVGHYLSSLSDNELVKIGLYAFGEDVEVYAQDAKKEILDHFSKMKATMGGAKADTKAPGGIIMEIKLFYTDGSTETITLPAFTYHTILGDQNFYLSIKEEDIWEPFRKHFCYDW